MEPPALPRFEDAQRRAFLKRAAAVGALALIPGLAACGKKDDKSTFSDASTTAASGSAASTTTTAAGDATTTSGGTASSGDALPDGATLDIGFTFAASGSGGPSRNPYVAAWVESAAGDLVANLGVWYDPPKGNRWINNLASWYSAVSDTDSGYLETTTGATQPAGTYTLSWDGTDATGERAAQGDYTVFVEAAQEHGNHSLTSAAITLGTSDTSVDLPDDTDLSAVTATYQA